MSSWSVTPHDGGWATVTIETSFCAGDGAAAGAHLKDAAVTALVVDLRALKSADKEMRAALRALHTLLHAANVRTAYLAQRPSVRGLALWVIHMCGDTQGRSVGSEQQATWWLGQTGDIVETSFARARRLEVG